MPYALILLLLLLLSGAEAQRSTEVFIPIGESPGISGTDRSVLGTVAAISSDRQVILVHRDDGTLEVVNLHGMREGPNGTVFLDRSRIIQRNGYGTLEDLQLGQTVEVKLGEHPWLKIRVDKENLR